MTPPFSASAENNIIFGTLDRSSQCAPASLLRADPANVPKMMLFSARWR